MKKLLVLSSLALLTSAIYFVSCQKENSAEMATIENPQSGDSNAVTDRGPLILGTVTTYCTCSSGRSCGTWAYTPTQRNAIQVVLAPVPHSYYNATGPGLRYRIYSGGSCSGTPIADFNCNLSTVRYANSALANGATYRVLISAGTSASPCYAITMGNCLGQSCGGDIE